MATRRKSTRRSASTKQVFRKTISEERIEQTTWALLVGVFAVLHLLPDGTAVPNWAPPLAGAIILLGSGVYQYSRKWRVAPVVWIGGSLMAVAAYYGWQMNPQTDLLGFTLLVFAAVIGFGLVTGEG